MSHWKEEMVARRGTPSPGLDHATLPAQCGGKVTHTQLPASLGSQRLPIHFQFLSLRPSVLLYHSIFFLET
jgi:hypothetical protein